MKAKMKCSMYITIIAYLSITMSCSYEEIKVKGFIFNVDIETFYIQYRYMYNDKLYTNRAHFEVVDQYIYGDSIIVIFPINKPQEGKPDSIFFRRQEVDIPFSIINNSDNTTPIFSYNSLYEKPIISISSSADSNKIKLKEYVYARKKEIGVNGVGTVGGKLTISEQGNFEKVEVLKSSGNASLDKFVEETILSIPKGTPGKNEKGETVKTSLIVEFDFK